MADCTYTPQEKRGPYMPFSPYSGGTTEAKWGDITGTITNQLDLIQYIAEHGGGGGAPVWGTITGNIELQADLVAKLNKLGSAIEISYDTNKITTKLKGQDGTVLSTSSTDIDVVHRWGNINGNINAQTDLVDKLAELGASAELKYVGDKLTLTLKNSDGTTLSSKTVTIETGESEWGSITGTIDNQKDLMNKLIKLGAVIDTNFVDGKLTTALYNDEGSKISETVTDVKVLPEYIADTFLHVDGGKKIEWIPMSVKFSDITGDIVDNLQLTEALNKKVDLVDPTVPIKIGKDTIGVYFEY